MNSKLMKIRNALVTVNVPVYHYWRTVKNVPYIIWQEDGEGDSIHSDNHKEEQVITGTIDYFTREEYDKNVESIQNALNDLENCGWNLSNVDYEDETNLIHFTWDFQII